MGARDSRQPHKEGRFYILHDMSEKLVYNYQSQDSNFTLYIHRKDLRIHHVYWIFRECNYCVKRRKFVLRFVQNFTRNLSLFQTLTPQYPSIGLHA